MPSERVQRQIDRLLDEAEASMSRAEWQLVAERARAVLGIDPENEKAESFLAMAAPNLGVAHSASPDPASSRSK